MMNLLLGNRVKELRIEMGLSQSELGRRVGYTKQGISKIEKNQNKYSDFNLIDKLAYELNCTRDYLIGLSEKKDTMRNGLKPLISIDPNWELQKALNEACLKNRDLAKTFLDCATKLNKEEQRIVINLLELILYKK